MKKKNMFFLVLGALLFASSSLSPASAQVSEKAFTYGVWIHPGIFGSEEKEAKAKIEATLDRYRQAGINTLIVLVKNTTGYVYYPSRIGSQDPAYPWDFFGVFLEAAQKRGLDVHPWFCVFTEGAIPKPVRDHPEWLISNNKGELVTVVNPALPQVREYERSLMLELAERYPVNWIHLDYIRFPCSPAETYFSFDRETCALFEKFSGQNPAQIKATDSGNIFWNEWLEWNRNQVTLFVRELKDALQTSTRKVKISAAVFPSADNAKVLIGQDWESWTKEGLVDMLCPMLYINPLGLFEKYSRRAVKAGQGRCSVCPGIGIGSSHNQNTPEGMAEQIRTSRALGADGVIFFSGYSLTEPFLKKLEEMR